VSEARVEPLSRHARLGVGERTTVPVQFTNVGSRTWSSDVTAPVRASNRWIDERGTPVITDGPRTPFPAPVDPGDSVELALDVYVPVRPGRYRVEIDVVEEGVRWLGEPAAMEVEATAPARMRAARLAARARSRSPRARWRRSRSAGSIPRVIHRVWVGEAPLSEEDRHYGETWERHHPGWEMRLWGDRDVRGLVPARRLRVCRDHAEASNLIRYELLRRFGGVYADTDVECRRSLEPLIEGVEAFAAWETPDRLGTAVLGSTPGHPVFELAALEGRLTAGMSVNGVESNGPGFLTQVRSERPLLKVFDSGVFYPYRWDEPQRRDESFPDAYAVHHWAMSWVPE
jgi:hypothetical protein